MIFVKEFIYCAFAAFAFAFLFNAPRRSLLVTALVSAVGYVLYSLIAVGGNPIIGFFAGTALIALGSELAARKLKMPVNVFISAAVIPLVPGIGLYQTMLSMVQGKYSLAFSTFVSAMLAISAMAVAIAMVSFVFRVTLKR